MLAKLKKLATTETGKDTFIVFWGTILNVIIGGIFFIIAPRLLGPTNYGLFATVYTTSVLTVRLTSLGIDTGILRFTNSLSKDSNAFLVIALKWYLFLGIAAGVVGYIISPKLAHILAQPSITNLLRIAFASTILFHLTNLFTAGLQAKREFKKAAIMLIANNTSRLLLLIAGSYFFIINLYLLTLTFFLSAIASVIIGGFFMPFEITKINRDLEKKFFKFNIWIWLSLTLSAIPFDNYLLLKIAGPLQTGLYAAPFKFLNYAYQIGGNFTAVLASRFSSFENDSKAKIYSLKAAIFPLLFSVIFLFFILFSDLVILLLFGKQYLGAAEILRILSVGSIFFFMATIPSSVILYYFGKSSISFVITVLKYLLFVILLIVLIPSKQAIGAAYSFTVSEGFAFVLMAAYVLIRFQKKDAN